MTKTQQNNIFDESNNVAILSRSIPKVGIQLKTQVLALSMLCELFFFRRKRMNEWRE